MSKSHQNLRWHVQHRQYLAEAQTFYSLGKRFLMHWPLLVSNIEAAGALLLIICFACPAPKNAMLTDMIGRSRLDCPNELMIERILYLCYERQSRPTRSEVCELEGVHASNPDTLERTVVLLDHAGLTEEGQKLRKVAIAQVEQRIISFLGARQLDCVVLITQ